MKTKSRKGDELCDLEVPGRTRSPGLWRVVWGPPGLQEADTGLGFPLAATWKRVLEDGGRPGADTPVTGPSAA